MNRQLIYRILAGSLFLLFPFIMQAQVILKNWAIEDHSGEMQIMVSGDTLDITAPKGLTLWYNKRLTGDYEISYRIKMLMQGRKYDRLSDLNCFWGANDPEHPENLHAQAAWRKGIFQHYKSLKLFYVGYGGNHNSTTRFRQYYGGGPSLNDSIARPVIKEYTDPAHLLFPNQWYHIQIRVQKGTIDRKAKYNANPHKTKLFRAICQNNWYRFLILRCGMLYFHNKIRNLFEGYFLK